MSSRGDVCALGVEALGRAYRAGELSPVAVCEAVLARIGRLDPSLHAFISVTADRALTEARAAERRFRDGIDLGPLQGIPYSVKDCIRAAGTRTTAASRLLADAPPDEADAEVVARLTAAGAVLIGKTNLYEFVFAEPGPDDLFPQTQNPRGRGLRAGGSSSGSAAAVAAGLGVFSLGTDTGGSVRHPANLCGVVGYVAAAGAISNDGTIPVSHRLDRVGILARDVDDVARCADVVANQPAPAGRGVPRVALGGNRIFKLGAAEAVAACRGVADLLAGLGIACPSVEVPLAERANWAADTIMGVDAVVYHERFASRSHLYGRNFVARIQPSRVAPASDYAKACDIRAAMHTAWRDLFRSIDILVLPGNMSAAPHQDQETITVEGIETPVRMVTSPATRASSLTGYPSLVLPVAQSTDVLPIGVQLVARPGAEGMLFELARALEAGTGNLSRKWGIEPRN